MPKTTIPIKTMMCPLGIGNLSNDPECRFHRSSDSLPEDGLCPIHQLKLKKTTRREDKITITIADEEEVETMEKEDPTLGKNEDGTIKTKLLNNTEKNALREKIRADIIKYKELED